MEIPQANGHVDAPVECPWVEIPGGLLRELAQVPCVVQTPRGQDRPIAQWFTADGRYLRAVKYTGEGEGAFWNLDVEGELSKWGSSGYVGSCMSSARAHGIIRDLVQEYTANLQLELI